MLQHDCVVPGLSDGGAHVGMICDGSFPTTNIVHWTRDRTARPEALLETMVKAQCRDTAETVGFFDRGLLEPGYRARHQRHRLRPPDAEGAQVAYDLPTGGRRLIQRPGATRDRSSRPMVQPIRDGTPTDALARPAASAGPSPLRQDGRE
jgi:N-acyl-D-aspartate/D-glutamate deacylase